MNKEFLRKLTSKRIFQTQIFLTKPEEKVIDIEKDNLFFDFLKNNDTIPEFEIKSEEPILDPKIFNKSNAFYNAFEKMKEVINWKNYNFPKIIFIKLYQKSKNLRKRIIKFSLINLKSVSDVIESYNPKYNQSKKTHNWQKTPKESFNLYYQNVLKKNNLLSDKEKDKNDIKFNLIQKEIGEKSNIIILTRNNNEKKNLIFSGKLCDVYVQSEFSRSKSKNNKVNKEFVFSLLNNPKFLNKQNENEKKANNYINSEKQLFEKKYKLSEKKQYKLTTLNNLALYNSITNSSKKTTYLKSSLPTFQKASRNQSNKNCLNNNKSTKNFLTISVNKKIEKKIPRLKQFLLNKTDFYY